MDNKYEYNLQLYVWLRTQDIKWVSVFFSISAKCMKSHATRLWDDIWMANDFTHFVCVHGILPVKNCLCMEYATETVETFKTADAVIDVAT